MRTRETHLDAERLAALAAGLERPTPGEAGHMQQCGQCAAAVQGLRDDLARLGEVAASHAPQPRQQVRLPESRGAAWRGWRRPAAPRVLGLGAGVAATAAGLLLLIWVGFGTQNAPPGPESGSQMAQAPHSTPGALPEAAVVADRPGQGGLPPALQQLLDSELATAQQRLAARGMPTEGLAGKGGGLLMARGMAGIMDPEGDPLPAFVHDVIDDHGENLGGGGGLGFGALPGEGGSALDLMDAGGIFS